MFDDDFKRILKDRAYSCDLAELDVLLNKFGHDDDCLMQIKRGIYDRLNREDSGDWTSSASAGWKVTNDKKKHLEQFILDRGPKGMFNAAATPAHDDTIAQLQQQVRDLSSRVQRLEQGERKKFRL